MLSTKFGLIFAVFAATTYISISISSVSAVETCAKYGQICNSTYLNNTELWLTCSYPNQTNCGCQTGMHWSQADNSCLAKVGESCYTALEDGRALKLCTKDAECKRIKSSAPTKEYRCYCDKMMTVGDEDGYCKSTFNGSCNNNLDCLGLGALTCDYANQKCVCDFHGVGQQIWDESAMICGSLIGGTCNVNASNYVDQKCLAPNSRCGSNNLCECDAGFTLHDGLCVVDYNNTCTASSNCAPTFICREEPVVNTTAVNSRLFNSISKIPRDTPALLSGSSTKAESKCLCNETLSIYDQSTKTCRTLPDKCNPAAINSTTNCVPNSDLQLCTDTEGASGFTCSCAAGYQADGNSCLGLHNASCVASTDCYEKEYLGCTASKCDCKTGYKYNAGTRKCIANLGQPCYDNSYCDDQAGATCPASKACACKSGYTEKDLSGSKICVGTVNSTCSTTLLCDSDVYLKCQGGKCVCAQDHLWENSSGKTQCWGLAGGVCGGTNGACPNNSTCSAVAENNSTQICKCADGFLENESKRCTSGATSIQITGITSVLVAIFIAFKN